MSSPRISSIYTQRCDSISFGKLELFADGILQILYGRIFDTWIGFYHLYNSYPYWLLNYFFWNFITIYSNLESTSLSHAWSSSCNSSIKSRWNLFNRYGPQTLLFCCQILTLKCGFVRKRYIFWCENMIFQLSVLSVKTLIFCAKSIAMLRLGKKMFGKKNCE